MHFSFRLGGLNPQLQQAFNRTLETWLLLGTLGLRATRAGGSFAWQPLLGEAFEMPKSLEAWSARCAELLNGAPLKYCVADQSFKTSEQARRVISDTIGGRDDNDYKNSLAQIRHPLGNAGGGRKTSPLRFRVIRIGEHFHIAAVWDDRKQVTKNESEDLTKVLQLLANRGKEIGRMFVNKMK